MIVCVVDVIATVVVVVVVDVVVNDNDDYGYRQSYRIGHRKVTVEYWL